MAILVFNPATVVCRKDPPAYWPRYSDGSPVAEPGSDFEDYEIRPSPSKKAKKSNRANHRERST
jgi:hypothetical protein